MNSNILLSNNDWEGDARILESKLFHSRIVEGQCLLKKLIDFSWRYITRLTCRFLIDAFEINWHLLSDPSASDNQLLILEYYWRKNWERVVLIIFLLKWILPHTLTCLRWGSFSIGKSSCFISLKSLIRSKVVVSAILILENSGVWSANLLWTAMKIIR